MKRRLSLKPPLSPSSTDGEGAGAEILKEISFPDYCYARLRSRRAAKHAPAGHEDGLLNTSLHYFSFPKQKRAQILASQLSFSFEKSVKLY